MPSKQPTAASAADDSPLPEPPPPGLRIVTPSTERTYADALRVYDRWNASADRSAAPLTFDRAARYLAARVEAGVAPATLRVDRAALIRRAREQQIPDADEFATKLNARLKRLLHDPRLVAHQPKRAKPLTPAEVQRVLAHPLPPEADSRAHRRARDAKAAIAIGWYAGLRRAEIASIAPEDIAYEDDGSAVITIRSSKTDQLGRGARAVIPPDAVQHVRAQSRTRLPDHPRLLHRDSPALGRLIKAYIAEAGIEDDRTSHTLRRGAAVTAARAGLSPEEIRELGRWTTTETAEYYYADAAGIDLDRANDRLQRIAAANAGLGYTGAMPPEPPAPPAPEEWHPQNARAAPRRTRPVFTLPQLPPIIPPGIFREPIERALREHSRLTQEAITRLLQELGRDYKAAIAAAG